MEKEGEKKEEEDDLSSGARTPVKAFNKSACLPRGPKLGKTMMGSFLVLGRC